MDTPQQMIGGKSQDPETDSDFRLAPGSFTKLENLIFNHHTQRGTG
jgi:hypothetical protein